MKRHHKKRTGILLLLILAQRISSCASDNGGASADDGISADSGTGTTPTAETAVTSADVTTEDSGTFALPDTLDYGGTTFTVLAVDEDVPYTYFEDYDSETGDVMNDAIFSRNRTVEEYLNIRFETVNCSHGSEVSNVQKDAASGDGVYDLISPHILSQIPALVTSGLLTDLGELEYVDFTQPWWNGSFVENMQLKGMTYYASGNIIAPNIRVIVFNKALVENYDMSDPYEAVSNGTWTLDTMAKYTKGFYNDINGNGEMDADDLYAFSDLSNSGLATSFIHGSGLLFVESAGDTYSLTLGTETEKIHGIMEKLYDNIYLEGNTAITNTEFANGTVLFGTQVLLKLQLLRDSEVSFGIIPFPKYDETQDAYYSSAWNGLLCVPVSATDLSMSGAVMEALAYFSTDTLVPAYYEKLLGGKFARDDTSVKMLDLIFDSVVYDIGLCFDGFIGNYALPGNLLNQGSTDIASEFAKKEATFTGHYKELFASVPG